MSQDDRKLWKALAVPLAACAVVTSFTAALASAAAAPEIAPEPYDWSPAMMWGGGWSTMMFGPFVMVLILGVVIAAIVLAVRWLTGPSPAHHGLVGSNALDILNQRFARGEIDQAEYESKRRTILQS